MQDHPLGILHSIPTTVRSTFHRLDIYNAEKMKSWNKLAQSTSTNRHLTYVIRCSNRNAILVRMPAHV